MTMWKYSISWPVRRGVEVASGADGQPARAADVSGMHDAGAHPILVARQVLLDGQLVDAVLPVGCLGASSVVRTMALRPYDQTLPV